MFKIRRNVFETNSSSTHSITFMRRDEKLDKNILPISSDNYIHIRLGEFGWEIASYTDQYNKLSYLLTMCAELNHVDFWYSDKSKFEEALDELYGCDDFQMISEAIGAYAGCNGIRIDESEGYIDHQSYEDYSNISDFLNQNNTNILDFVFGNVVVNTDNDNH